MITIKDAITKYPINLDTITSIAEDFGKIAEKLSPSGAIRWLGDLTDRVIGESCNYCQDSKHYLLHGEVHGEIDGKTGELSIWKDKNKIACQKVNYCPMCGRPVGGRA